MERSSSLWPSYLAFGTWFAFLVALVGLWDPPPEPRYSGSIDPPTVLVVLLVFYGIAGSMTCLALGVVSMVFAWSLFISNKFRGWLAICVNIATLVIVYASVPIWFWWLRD